MIVRSAALTAVLGTVVIGTCALAPVTPPALEAARASFAAINDYTSTIVVHETDGKNVQDRTYHVLFKKPSMEKVEVVAGAGKGSGLVWLGGDTVKGHTGGIFGGVRITMSLHNSRVTTLRGDSVAQGTIASLLDMFRTVKGTVSQTPGPTIDGTPTTAVRLDVADPATQNGVTRIVLDLSDVTHLPLRHEEYVGADLVKSEEVSAMSVNVGLTAADFPW